MVFDIETTGFSPLVNKIIEIGAVKVEKGNITERFLTEKVTRECREFQSVRSGEYQTFLDIERGVAVDGAVIADFVVVRAFRQVDGVDEEKKS